MKLSRIRRFVALSLPAVIAALALSANPVASAPAKSIASTKENASIILQIDSVDAMHGKKKVELEAAPLLTEEQIALVPLRFIVDALGGEIDWDPEIQLITITHKKQEILLYIGKAIAYVDGDVTELDDAPQIVEGVTMVPVRFVGETLRQTVKWVAEKQQIILTPQAD